MPNLRMNFSKAEVITKLGLQDVERDGQWKKFEVSGTAIDDSRHQYFQSPRADGCCFRYVFPSIIDKTTPTSNFGPHDFLIAHG